MGAECIGGSITAGPLTSMVMYMVLRTGFNRQSVLVDAGVATGR